jgi:hypothetical protein
MIQAALGLAQNGVAPGEWTPRGPALAIYPYHDEEGELLFEVCRTADKQFPTRRPDPSAKYGVRWNLNGTRRVLYRLPELVAAVAAGQPIYVVEGEKDVESIRRTGAAATCNPHGAGKWRFEYGAFLRGVDVRIVADCDAEGREHARQVAASLEGVARSVVAHEPAVGKDASDHLAAGRSLGELLPLTGGPEAKGGVPAFALAIEEFVAAKDESPAALFGTPDDAIFPAGGLMILGGKPGVGKTTFAVDAATAAAGTLSEPFLPPSRCRLARTPRVRVCRCGLHRGSVRCRAETASTQAVSIPLLSSQPVLGDS